MNTKTQLFILLLTLSPLNAWSICYDKNKAIEINFKHCKQAAEQNDSMGQYFLAQMYRQGEGVEKDPQKAIQWYRRAANQGNRLAQYNLGWIFEVGEDVPKAKNEAIKWYTLAAEQGDKYAPFNLGTIYYTGSGESKGLVKTHFWFGVAVINGNLKAKKWQDKIAKKMSPEQIAEARRLLGEWQREKGAAGSEEPIH